MLSAQNLLSIYTKSYTHTSLSFSFQHLIANGYFLWIISINKGKDFSEQNKAIEQSLTEAATADPSIVAESQRSEHRVGASYLR